MIEWPLAVPLVNQMISLLPVTMATCPTCMFTPMNGEMVHQILGSREGLATSWEVAHVHLTFDPVHELYMIIQLTPVLENMSVVCHIPIHL